MSDVQGGGQPILSDDGHWWWNGHQWLPVHPATPPVSTPAPIATTPNPAEVAPLTQTGPTATSGTAAASPRPFDRGWIVRRGLLIATWGIGMTLVLTLAAGLAVISGALLVVQAILGPAFGTSAPTTSSSGISPDQLLNAFIYVFGFFFFTSNGTPYHVSLGSSDTTVAGLGALLIAVVVVLVSFSSGRALARREPGVGLARIAAYAGLLAIPYWAIAVVLLFASSVHGDFGLFGQFTAGPTGYGLVLPLLMVGVPAVAGAAIGNVGLSGEFARGLTRGAGFGLVAILLGVIGTILGAIVAGIANAAGGNGGTTPFGNGIPSAPAPTPDTSGAGSSSDTSTGVLFIAAGVLVGLIYLLNGVALLWAGNLAFELTAWSLWPLILVLGLVGVLIGAMPLRLRNDFSEQIGFALSFGVVSFLIAEFTHPVLGTFELGPQPGTVFIVGLVLGGAASVGGPFLAMTPVGRMAAGLFPISSLVRRTEFVFGLGRTAAALGAASADGFRFVWNRRVATGVAVAVVAVLVLASGGVYGTSVTSPEAIAKSYISSVGLNDAAAIWDDVDVSGSSGATQHLTGQSDLKAMMALSENHHPLRDAIATTRTDSNGSSSTVTVSWNEGSQAQSETLVLHRGTDNRYLFFSNWRIVIVPATLSFDLPAPDTKVAVDGTPVSASGNTVTVSVLPGFHKVSASASSLFDADTQTVNVSGDSTTVKFNLTLTSAASNAITTSLGAFFAKCAAATVASPDGCPQSSFDSGSGFKWTIVGDPSATLALSMDSSNKVHAIGHYLMLDTFRGGFSGGLHHRFEAGPFEAVMTWSGGSMNIESVSRAFGAPQLTPPPDVTDAKVKAAVSAAFKACTKAPPDGTPDCPQYDFVFQATNFHWTIKGNPLSGAAVSFDADQGIWKVTGNYTFHDSYDESYLGHQEYDRSGTYSAYVIYTGTKVVAVYISQF